MPELPEVESAARLLRAAIEGTTLRSARVLHPALRRRLPRGALRALAGARVTAVERRGKHQLIHFNDGRVLHVHFRMNGDWIIGPTSEPMPRFARAVFHFEPDTRVVLDDSRALSTIDVHAAGVDLPLDLGPEPFDPRLTPAALRAALSRRRIPIKVALLDQHVIAGLGNIYASESLWRARIDPRTAASSLDVAASRRLLSAIRAVIRRATGGRYSRLGGARLDVYDREGQPCRRCRTPIARLVQSGRSTYYCPHCQSDPGLVSANRGLRGRRSSNTPSRAR
ncbi:MAG TPA: bifunctional DNA-formamidopyrimidine glycosylase/DNA-(apurinic or apyrimidinic site) lyase [Gemmatimonadaceae bacterium]|nr:bifunctional DNA-formamidopyrimidine glycosylase/DNA-(apurinic or apyrimidinic site) lyase [Gemmatimonadaceae bacterium]